MGKIPGIALILSIASLITVAALIYSDRPNPPSDYLKAGMALLVVSVCMAGIYLIRNYCPSTKKMAKIQIYTLGLLLMIFGTLTSFNYIDFLNAFNWVIATGIVFVMLVQLQLLNWGDKTGSVVKICSVLLMLSNLFLAVAFITKWNYSAVMYGFNAAFTVSLLSFGIGIAFLPRKSRRIQEEDVMNT